MKKLFKTHIAFNTIFSLIAIYFLMIMGCEQAAEIIQSVQNVTPVASDFTFIGLTATANGNPVTVGIKPKTGKSQGEITVYYEGTSGTVYPKSVNAPSAAGKYAVTFDVEAVEGFNAAKSLKAGTLTINVKNAGASESEDEDDTEDDYTDDGNVNDGNDNEDDEDLINDDGFTEEIVEPLRLIDFEDGAWTVGLYNSANNRIITFKGYDWSVSGITKMDDKDHYIGSRGIRFRGSNSNSNDKNNINHLELVNFLSDGIESISFDYASYGGHSNGKIILSCKKEEGEWEEVDRIINIPSWIDGGSQMLNAKFEVNITGKVRFKIEKVNASGSTSVNIDNILITTF
jgi:hypothetical protein